MNRYRCEVATRTDDDELRRMLAETPMPGHVSVSFRREPSFFEAAVVNGGFHQTMIIRDCEEARIACLGSRSVRDRYVNGQPMAIGYLSSLRLLPQYRGSGLLARGYRFFRRLHGDERTRLYLTTIAEGNVTALSVLTSGRGGLPRYHFAGMYHTVAIPLVRGKHRLNGAQQAVEIREATAADLPGLLRFLQTAGPTRQFFPQYEADDFFHPQGTFRDLEPLDLLLAFRESRLVGTLARWDQSRFRQAVVERYATHLHWTRPVYNCWASLRGLPKLPKPGECFRFLTAALPLVLHDDPQVFTALLRALIERTAPVFCQYLLIGMHESDPLLPAVKMYQSTSYLTRLYHVCWEDGESLRTKLDTRPPYLELGCL